MTSTANPEPCKLHPPTYVTMRTVPANHDREYRVGATYYVTASTPGTRRGDEMIKLNRRLSGKDYTCDCPRCSTK